MKTYNLVYELIEEILSHDDEKPFVMINPLNLFS